MELGRVNPNYPLGINGLAQIAYNLTAPDLMRAALAGAET